MFIKQKKHYTDKNLIFFCSSWGKFFFLPQVYIFQILYNDSI